MLSLLFRAINRSEWSSLWRACRGAINQHGLDLYKDWKKANPNDPRVILRDDKNRPRPEPEPMKDDIMLSVDVVIQGDMEGVSLPYVPPPRQNAE